MAERKAWVLALVTAVLVPAVRVRADEVVLRSGGRLTGEILERTADHVVIDVAGGQITVPAAFVQQIVPNLTRAAFSARAAKLAIEDARGWLELGQWARGVGFDQGADAAFMRVLMVEPDSVDANLALGRVQLGERWLSPDEAMRARGYVKFEESWMRPEERDALQRARARQAEVARAQLARAEEEARVREAEARAREAEARVREAEARAQEATARASAAEEAERARREAHAQAHARRLQAAQNVAFTVCTVNGRSFFCAPPPYDPSCARAPELARLQRNHR
jgi:hypothetical protein